MSLKVILASVLFYLFYLAVAFGLSGFLDRAYSVLPQEGTVQLAQTSLSVEQMAAQYRPIFWHPTQKETPPPQRLLYEVIDNNEYYTLVYRVEWKNEVVPHGVKDVLYAVYRFLYYGFTLRDIEYIQLDVRKHDGMIERVQFETKTTENNYYTVAQEHVLLTLQRANEAGSYQKTLHHENAPAPETLLLGNAPNFHIKVVSWNHLMDIAPTDFQGNGFERVRFELTYLTDSIYKRSKMARRGEGDFKTAESPMNTPIIFFVSIFVMFYFVTILADYTKNKNKFPHEVEDQA